MAAQSEGAGMQCFFGFVVRRSMRSAAGILIFLALTTKDEGDSRLSNRE